MTNVADKPTNKINQSVKTQSLYYITSAAVAVDSSHVTASSQYGEMEGQSSRF